MRREHVEGSDALRNPFACDRRRIIACTAFRRLEHKTQVFAPAHHDHFRTRLTHTLEVTEIARTLARALRANESLAEAIALAHDLGHPPFGHAGESALHECLAAIGGFNHNLHALRVVEYLEHPFPAFRGLNLTAATRAGLAGHATPYDEPERRESPAPHVKSDEATPSAPVTNDTGIALLVESQIVSLADRVAYNIHDLEDAMGAGLVDLGALGGIDLWRSAFATLDPRHHALGLFAFRRPMLDAMLDEVLADCLAVDRQRLPGESANPDAAPGNAPASMLRFSSAMAERLGQLERFLLERVYRHPDIAATDRRGQEKICGLFAAYLADPGRLPPRFAVRIAEQGAERVIGDYLAGMTDRFCEAEYKHWCPSRIRGDRSREA